MTGSTACWQRVSFLHFSCSINFMSTNKINLAVFGSTGSIGRSTLEIVRMFPDKFNVSVLAANSSVELMAEQIAEFKPQYAGLTDEASAVKLKSVINTNAVKLVSGEDVFSLAGDADYDLMLAAIVGFSGLQSVLNAIDSGKNIALANKESLVAAGSLVLSKAKEKNVKVVPVDSEHSAVYQLLEGQNRQDLESITITASGGPFLKRDLKDFDSIKPDEAIKHPRWQMGKKISLDSATLFNKALEFIEATWLFNLPPEKVDVVVHPQSLVHSLINFKDGSTFAHMSETDMKGAIGYAINYPRPLLEKVLKKLDLPKIASLEFLELDQEKFPAIEIARKALTMGKAAGAVLNSANEYAGQAFMQGKVSFRSIYELVNDALSHFGALNYSNYEDLLEIDKRVGENLQRQIR